MNIRPAVTADRSAIWQILEPVIRAGETYALPRDMDEAAAVAYWTGHMPYVAERDGDIVGTYYLRPNQAGPGGHVANAGYVTATHATGQGVARAMCQHSLSEARTHGFRAMQFNLVVSTNTRAIALWHDLGFATVGTLPGAFAHPTQGDVDALVMYRTLV